MKLSLFLFFVGFSLSPNAPARAESLVGNKDRLIARIEGIAVVEVTHTERIEARGVLDTYTQKATAKVERVLKGRLPGTVSLYGGEHGPACADCNL